MVVFSYVKYHDTQKFIQHYVNTDFYSINDEISRRKTWIIGTCDIRFNSNHEISVLNLRQTVKWHC